MMKGLADMQIQVAPELAEALQKDFDADGDGDQDVMVFNDEQANELLLKEFSINITQAGTYVKEFVHSDFGRTCPSVGSLLGCEADILQLDVLGLREPGAK